MLCECSMVGQFPGAENQLGSSLTPRLPSSEGSCEDWSTSVELGARLRESLEGKLTKVKLSPAVLHAPSCSGKDTRRTSRRTVW